MIKIDLNPSERQLRNFGFIALFGFSLIATVVMWTFTDWTVAWFIWLLFGFAGLCPILSLISPKLNKPIYVSLMVITMPIGFVISNVVMRLIYYGLFTPMALWFKLRGRDTMDRTLDPDAETYWKDHRDVAKPRAAASYLRLY